MVQDIYIINLEERKDRWDKFIKGISGYKTINPIQFDAVKKSPGFIGCALSHIAVVEMAQRKGLDFVVVMEDDTRIINNNFDTYFNNLIEYLKKDKSWLIFNGNPSCCNERRQQNVNVINRNPNILTFDFGYTTNFMIYSSRAFNKIIRLKELYTQPNLNMKTHAIDVQFNNFKKITMIPYITSQMTGMSDIENRIISYDSFIIGNGMEFLKARTGLK